MIGHNTRISGALSPGEGRRRKTVTRRLHLRSTLWGGVSVALIGFLAWLVLWSNETGGLLP